MNDYCETKEIRVVIQENGIIRNAESGWIIGRLVDEIEFDSDHLNQQSSMVLAYTLEEEEET